IGDAIMGVFVSPLQALKYAVQTQRDIRDLNRKIGEELIQLKIGIHFGPALAVTMNEKLDYFGSTVNLAARTEGQCLGGDIVITKKLYEYPGVIEFLGTLGARLEQFSANLKGFSTSMEMIRISL
ncbi:MAG TPA: adenylate/guanylate cyclase domain-containing protein, partial [Leptospiraceae bacterium]|nr:adenylate/guanylate cyclase domain-containing protein [Leptospiraceae bacterium]